MTALESRGTDAAGIAIQNRDALHVLRDDKPAYAFVGTDAYKNFIRDNLQPRTLSVIVHTRSATTGRPSVNHNNHPMFYDKTAVVHNGIIHNHFTLFQDLKLERRAETDSDILRAITDAEGLSKKAIRLIDRCNGSVAMAALSAHEPEKLLLVRSGSPLVLAEVGDTLVFASEKGMIHKAMRPWRAKWGIDFQQQRFDIAFRNMPDNTAWLFGATDLEWHDKCQTTSSYLEPCRTVWNKHQKQSKYWGMEEDVRPKEDAAGSGATNVSNRELVASDNLFRLQCDSCKTFNKFDEKHMNTPLSLLDCGTCGKCLDPGESEEG